MSGWNLLLPILIPVALAVLVLLIPKKDKWLKEALTFAGVTVNLILSIMWFGSNFGFVSQWCGFGIDFSLKLYQFSSFIFLAVSGFAFLIVIYSMVFMKGKESSKLFYTYLLITVALVNGAVFANNLVVMLFFWEGLLVTLFGMIMTGSRAAFPTAVKALVLSGVADLCLMLGVGTTIYLSNGVSTMDKIHLPMNFAGSCAFVLLMIGAIAKAGLWHLSPPVSLPPFPRQSLFLPHNVCILPQTYHKDL